MVAAAAYRPLRLAAASVGAAAAAALAWEEKQSRGQAARCDLATGTAAAAAAAAPAGQLQQHERACSLILQHLAGRSNGSGSSGSGSRRGGGGGGGGLGTGDRVARWLRRTRRGEECRDALGRSALALAAMQGEAEAAEVLLTAGGYDPNAPDGNRLSPLSYAAWRGHADVVRLLLAHGADPAHMDDFGVTPLHKSAAFGHPLVLSQLLRTGQVSVDLRTGPVRAPPAYEAKTQHQTPLHLALRPSANVSPAQRREMVEILLGFGASPNVGDINGETAVHYAVRLGDPLVLWAVVARGRGDASVRSAKGETALDLVTWRTAYLAPLLLLVGVVG